MHAASFILAEDNEPQKSYQQYSKRHDTKFRVRVSDTHTPDNKKFSCPVSGLMCYMALHG